MTTDISQDEVKKLFEGYNRELTTMVKELTQRAVQKALERITPGRPGALREAESLTTPGYKRTETYKITFKNGKQVNSPRTYKYFYSDGRPITDPLTLQRIKDSEREA